MSAQSPLPTAGTQPTALTVDKSLSHVCVGKLFGRKVRVVEGEKGKTRLVSDSFFSYLMKRLFWGKEQYHISNKNLIQIATTGQKEEKRIVVEILLRRMAKKGEPKDLLSNLSAHTLLEIKLIAKPKGSLKAVANTFVDCAKKKGISRTLARLAFSECTTPEHVDKVASWLDFPRTAAVPPPLTPVTPAPGKEWFDVLKGSAAFSDLAGQFKKVAEALPRQPDAIDKRIMQQRLFEVTPHLKRELEASVRATKPNTIIEPNQMVEMMEVFIKACSLDKDALERLHKCLPHPSEMIDWAYGEEVFASILTRLHTAVESLLEGGKR